MIRTVSALAFVSALALAGTGSAFSADLDPAGRPTFMISARDGYGVAECLMQGNACSVQVANAWCAAQGYHHAANLRVMTGEDSRTHSDAIAVTCDN